MSNVRLLLLIMLFLLLFTTLSFSSVSELIYYNGTVIIHVYNQSIVYLPLENESKIQSTSPFIFKNGKIVLSNSNSVISYKARIDGVIKIVQPYNSTISIILPYNVQIYYLYPAPESSILTGNFLNLTFYTSNVTLVFSQVTVSRPNNNLLLILVVLLAISLAATATLAYMLFKNYRKEKVTEEVEVAIDSNKLDERDKLVLDAIKRGADTLAKISKMTNLPRTTAYRRVKKLVNLGYVEEIREKNKIRYVVNKNAEDDNKKV